MRIPEQVLASIVSGGLQLVAAIVIAFFVTRRIADSDLTLKQGELAVKKLELAHSLSVRALKDRDPRSIELLLPLGDDAVPALLALAHHYDDSIERAGAGNGPAYNQPQRYTSILCDGRRARAAAFLASERRGDWQAWMQTLEVLTAIAPAAHGPIEHLLKTAQSEDRKRTALRVLMALTAGEDGLPASLYDAVQALVLQPATSGLNRGYAVAILSHHRTSVPISVPNNRALDLRCIRLGASELSGKNYPVPRVGGSRARMLDLRRTEFAPETEIAGLRFDNVRIDETRFAGVTIRNSTLGRETHAMALAPSEEAADLSSATLAHVQFRSIDLTGAQFPRSTLTDVRFDSVSLSDANFDGATLGNVMVADSDLLNTSFEQVRLEALLLERTSFVAMRIRPSQGTTYAGLVISEGRQEYFRAAVFRDCDASVAGSARACEEIDLCECRKGMD